MSCLSACAWLGILRNDLRQGGLHKNPSKIDGKSNPTVRQNLIK